MPADDSQVPPRPLLFTPMQLRGVTLRNRIVVAPMCQYRSVEGEPTDWHLVYLGKMAQGGAAVVFCEETAVEERGRKTYECGGLYQDSQIPAYRRVNDFIRAMGALPAVQLGHAGNVASTHGAMQGWAPLTAADAANGMPPWQSIGPTARPAGPRHMPPLALDEVEIRQVLRAWSEATRRAVDAGFDICEIHGAHGYLIHQFLSPLSNTRTDGYGGDRAGRLRFALEVTEAVRAAWPADRPLFFRLSSIEAKGGVWGLEDSMALSEALSQRGVDVVDCSSGGLGGSSDLPALPRVPGYHVAYSSRIRRELGMKTVAVGLITQAAQAETLLQEGHADLIAMARELMYNPNWPVHAAKELGVSDALSLMPASDTFRLAGRDDHARSYPVGCEVRIPVGLGQDLPYSWDKLRPLMPEHDGEVAPRR